MHLKSIKKIAFSCILSLSCAACSIGAAATDEQAEAKVPADKSKFHVIVLMGQSNMEGSGYPVFSEYINGTPRVLRMNKDDMEWKQASLTLGPSSGISPGYVFARQYADMHPGVTVGFIQCALGGRSLQQLSENGERLSNGKTVYQDSIDRIKEAQKVGEIKAILWHQGESDSGDRNYVKRLAAYVEKLRKDINEPNVPFIAGEIGPWGGQVNFNRNIASLESSIPNSGLASAENLKHRGDEIHFSSFSHYILGSRYLAKFYKLTDKKMAEKYDAELKKIEADMYAKDNDWKIIYNGDMSLGEIRPLGWDARYYGQTGEVIGIKDTKVFASSPASLRVENVGGPASNHVGTCLRDVKGKKIRVSCKIKNEGFTECWLYFFGLNGGFSPCAEKILCDGTNAKEWTSYTAEYNVPASAIRDRLYFHVKGEGKAWLDDVKVEVIP